MTLNNGMNVEILRTTSGSKSGKTCFNCMQNQIFIKKKSGPKHEQKIVGNYSSQAP